MSQKKLLQKIEGRIRDFDLKSLVVALESVGIKRSEIYFESNPQNTSAKSLCESISFSKRFPKVRVVLNMGLLGANSPLPSYFQKLMDEEEIDAERFMRFLGFFNHLLIKQHLNLMLPEKNRDFFDDWEETHFHYLSLLGFESISTLWLLIKISFPELVVNIKKNARMLRLNSSSLVLGRDSLGPNSYIGERLEQTLSSFRIVFTTEDETSELGTPWPIEITNRLRKWLFPVLSKTDVHLSILLVIKHKTGHIHLTQNHHLGFDRIGLSTAPFELLLFHGYVKEIKKDLYQV